jgi:membrane associated rhomboid family serine protease
MPPDGVSFCNSAIGLAQGKLVRTWVGFVLASKPMARRNVVVPLLILLNIPVYLMWQNSDLDHFAANWTVSWSGLMEGRYWTLLTSVFSHNMFLHLLINMLVLSSFGGLMEQVLGRWRFLLFYLTAGIVASFTHAAVSAFYLGEPDLPAVGASGAIAGTVLLFSLMFPREKILALFVIPLPALVGALVFIGLDVWGLVAQAGGGGLPIGHGAHLGGSFTGILYYFLFIRRRWRRVRTDY